MRKSTQPEGKGETDPEKGHAQPTILNKMTEPTCLAQKESPTVNRKSAGACTGSRGGKLGQFRAHPASHQKPLGVVAGLQRPSSNPRGYLRNRYSVFVERLVLQRRVREECLPVPDRRRGASRVSAWLVRCALGCPPAIAAVHGVRTVPGAASLALPGTLGAG